MFRLFPLLALALVLGACQEPARPALMVIDQNAGAPGHQGAVFRIDPTDKTVTLFAAPAEFRQPQDIMQQPDGSFLVLDYYGEGGVGKVFRLSKDGKTCTEVPIPKGLVDPYQFERAPDGSIWIIDKNADPRGLGKAAKRKTGTIWQLSADLQSLKIIATGPPLMAPSGVIFADGDTFVLDADAYQIQPYNVANDEGAIFKLGKDGLEPLVKFKGLISPLAMHRLAPDQFLIIDVNADPVQRTRFRGAVYCVDLTTKKTTLFANHDQFRDPCTCLPFAGALLIMDANADPLGKGADGAHKNTHFAGDGRGGIFRLDLKTKTVGLFAASEQFVNPIRVRAAEL